MSKELQQSAQSQLAKREPTTLEIIGQIANSPNFGPAQMDVLERMIALKERTDAQERKEAFAAALAALQAELPQIDKRGKIIIVQGSERSRYARVEDIDNVIRPYLAKHGFSFAWDTEPSPAAGEIRYVGKLTHQRGHFEDKHVDLPIEDELSSQGKLLMTKVQKRGSTLSYAIRTLLRMHLNLVMRDEDNDGQGNVELVTAKDLTLIKELLAKVGGDGESAKFLAWMKVDKFEDIQRRDVTRALSFLRAKATEKKA